MTARDMLERDLQNPELTDKFIDIIVEACCPHEHGYEERCTGVRCDTCWDRDIVDADNTEEVKETTDMFENFDYETEYEKLRVVVDGQNTKIAELTKENVALTANRAKLQDDVRYWMDKAKRYELVVKAVEALVGRNIISEDDGYDD